MPNENLRKLSEKALSLPLKPGVYIMHDNSGKIIYIGKAKALKNRVSQYFRAGAVHLPKVQKMVDNVAEFEYIVCSSEFEALILEASLIKQNTPKYNILLKDDKGYHYIKISKGPFRKITSDVNNTDDGSRYLGPYNSAFITKQTVDEVCKTFSLPQCSKKFPADYKKSRPCLNYSIGICSAPCAGKISLNDYEESVDRAIEFLEGGSGSVIKTLTKKMEEAAENLEFERAAKIRDRINAIERIGQKQHIVASKIKNQDVFALSVNTENTCFEVFRFKDGKLFDREQFLFDVLPDDGQTRHEFLIQYYSMQREIPKQITIDSEPEDVDLLQRWLSEKSGYSVSIHVPKRGEQLELVKMCKANAAERLIILGGKKGRQLAVLEELAKLTGMKNIPKYIEAYDISNTAGDENVAGMIVFKDAKPYKSAYRRFKIKSFIGQDDFASMAEVLSRRFDEYLLHKDSNEGFGRLPDLILLDGGQGQLSSVLRVLKDKNINVPIFGMVKDGHHRTRALVSEDGEIEIKAVRQVFTLISSIQDEVHRFSVEYHRQRRSKSSIKTQLTDIDGIGEMRAKHLLKSFGSISKIKNATVEELESVNGMNNSAAKNIFDYFHKKS